MSNPQCRFDVHRGHILYIKLHFLTDKLFIHFLGFLAPTGISYVGNGNLPCATRDHQVATTFCLFSQPYATVSLITITAITFATFSWLAGFTGLTSFNWLTIFTRFTSFSSFSYLEND